MAPHIPDMRKNIANALNISLDQINVKATTEEGLGFTGEGLGISSQAICFCLLYTSKQSSSKFANNHTLFIIIYNIVNNY